MLSLWNPFIPVVRERSDSRISTKNYFDRLFEDTFSTMTHDLFSSPLARIGIENKKNEDGSLTVSVDIPGIKEEDITIEIQDNIVGIKGIRKTATSSYTVNKSFTIPEGYSSDDIRAELVDGVLSLTLVGKPLPQKEVKKIPITPPAEQLK
jgi:HSP20 family molecular chaperone IbpA